LLIQLIGEWSVTVLELYADTKKVTIGVLNTKTPDQENKDFA